MKTILVSYRISLTNKVSEKQILSRFNGEDDLLNTINDYCDYIHRNIVSYTDSTGNLRTFTLDGLQTLNNDNRNLYGYFDSAYTGEKLKIKEGVTNDILFNVGERDLQSRNFFFYIDVPSGAKYAYVVIQKKSNHAIKGVLENSFNDFLKFKGFLDYRVKLEYAPDYFLLNRMLEFGDLKEIKLIRKALFSTFEEQLLSEGTPNPGVFERILRFNSDSLTVDYKNVLYRLYRERYLDYQQVQVFNESFDEVSFVLSLDSRDKTFYVKDKSKIRSNIDVTSLVEYSDGEPTLESLIRVSVEIIRSSNSSSGDSDSVAA
ncbi:hypothetical protein [Flavobacterium sp. C4GT6]|uniref:hypothetical protein n=1 Tax=Flavobacterium sp. C4GT6 TaxID=3103818 RepID=UPI002ED2CAEE